VSLEQLGQFVVAGIVAGSIYALVALGFNVIFNATEIINFAQGEFVMLGGMFYYAATSTAGLPLVAALAVAVGGVTLVAALLEVMVIRPAAQATVLGLVLVTLAAALLAEAGARTIWGVNPLSVPSFTPGPPFQAGGVTITRQAVWVVASTLVVMAALRWFSTRTDTGLAMQAAALNREAAATVGISVRRMVFLSFLIAGLLGGIGAVLITPITKVHYELGLSMGIKGFTAAMLGGLGNMPAAVLGGLTLGLVESIAAGYVPSGLREAIPMSVLVLILLLRPTGILGTGAVDRA
jgi:branched-chain amino acid transport system permease protein